MYALNNKNLHGKHRCKSLGPLIRQYDTKGKITKENMNKIDFIKIKDVLHQRTLSRMWTYNPQNRKQIFANQVSDKGLVTRIYFLNAYNNKNTNFQIGK